MSPGLPAVLVLSGGGFQGLAAVRLLAESDAYRILVGDSLEAGVTEPFADAFLRLPPVAERGLFLASLVSVCREQGVRLVVPSTDHELETLSESRADLEGAGVRVAVCDPPLLSVLRDKRSLYESLAAAGLPVMPPVRLEESPDLPLIGKPRFGWGSRGMIVARTRAEVETLTREEGDSRVWQAFVEGAVELSADFALGTDGTFRGAGLRRRVRTSGGFAVVSETVRDPDAAELVRAFAAWAATRGGRGPFNVQLLRRESLLVLSDVNPRLGTSAAHWRGTGFNPLLAVCADAGLLPPDAGGSPPVARRRSVRHLEELFVPVEPAPAADVAGVVFDLDDTLIPTKRWQRERLLAALETIASGDDAARARCEGLRILEEGPRPRLVDALAEALGWDQETREHLRRVYRATWPARCLTYPDVKPALDALRRRGFRLGLLTDNPPETQRHKLDAAGLAAFFDAVVFAREAGREKPDGGGFARVARELGLEPPRLAMAGDNPHRDLAGAAAAGFGRLFLLRRAGAFASFDAALYADLPGAERFEAVADLRQLGARLTSPSR
jgi:HAD superfamily hydrolase (TIGR01549 family)